MSAAVCGKRTLPTFEEYGSPSVIKKVRCDESSPYAAAQQIGNSSAAPSGGLNSLFVLQQFFPGMEEQVIRDALAYSGDSIELAIQRLSELRIFQSQKDVEEQNVTQGSTITLHLTYTAADRKTDVLFPSSEASNASAAVQSTEPSKKLQGGDWVELAVHELSLSSSLEESRARMTRVFEAFEGAIREGGIWQKEVESLKNQVKRLVEENMILKRAVTIHHSRQVEYEERGKEVEKLKATMAQYEAEMRTLQMTNYTLNVHLKAAQRPADFPNRNNDIY